MKKQFLFYAIVVLLAMASLPSCHKSASREQDASSSITDAEALAVKFTQPLGKDYPGLRQAYSRLGTNDLKKFWLHIARLNRHKTQLSAGEEQEVLHRLAGYMEKSKARFGKAFNQLEGAQLQELVAVAAKHENAKIPPVDPNPGPVCPLYTYPLQFWPSTNPPSPPANYYTAVAFSAEGDCGAWEFSYAGTLWNQMRAITPLGEMVMINSSGSGWPWSARKSGGYTHVWAPDYFITYWFGTPASFSDHVRVTMGTISDF